MQFSVRTLMDVITNSGIIYLKELTINNIYLASIIYLKVDQNRVVYTPSIMLLSKCLSKTY